MQAYYGGRAEIRIRHIAVPTMYVDFTSQYPTVNTHLGLWDVLTAEELEVCEATSQVRAFLGSLKPDRLFDPKIWRKLNFFALVQPDGDILPVRTVYGQGNDQTNIGLNPLTSTEPVWYAGPDVVASWLLTGKLPRIIQAIRIKPVGKQSGMKRVALDAGHYAQCHDGSSQTESRSSTAVQFRIVSGRDKSIA
jgi:hypothetical protein